MTGLLNIREEEMRREEEEVKRGECTCTVRDKIRRRLGGCLRGVVKLEFTAMRDAENAI